ncbi:MAG: class I SAM-dependent methyltransferase [Parvularculaceae bacterium]
MRTDVLDLHAFYDGSLGATARGFIEAWLRAAWGEAARLRVAGFGYAAPYLDLFSAAERVLALSPAAQGVMRWPDPVEQTGAKNCACLVEENHWPLPDASIDRMLIVHGLEETSEPRRLMREIWRVLADDGRLIVIAPHRRGLWSMIDSTPFAAGRPYLKRQLETLFENSMFRARAWGAALYFPPFAARFMLRAAPAWERAGGRVWPGFGGVLIAEAEKELMAPALAADRVRARSAVVVKPSAAIGRSLLRPENSSPPVKRPAA